MGVSRLQVMRRVGDLTKKMKLSVAAFKGKSPGKDWFDGFMKRHQDLSIRKPEKLTTTRARMLNPVVVTNYLNDLDALLDKLDWKEKPDQIWNCDETGKNFEHQPVKVIAAKGEKSVVGRTSASSCNITIMACVNAAGRTMPPQFVVKGKTSKSLHGFNTSAAPVGTKWFIQKNG